MSDGHEARDYRTWPKAGGPLSTGIWEKRPYRRQWRLAATGLWTSHALAPVVHRLPSPIGHEIIHHHRIRKRRHVAERRCIALGNLTAAVARHGSGAAYHGIDPDEAAIAIARRKTRDAVPRPLFRTGPFSAGAVHDWPRPNKAALCLVLHQVELAEKARLLRELWLALADDGQLYIADYGAQRSRAMRWLFRLTIQQLDGVRDTQPNADGMLPMLIADAGFGGIREVAQFRTITGSLSIIAAKKAA